MDNIFTFNPRKLAPIDDPIEDFFNRLPSPEDNFKAPLGKRPTEDANFASMVLVQQSLNNVTSSDPDFNDTSKLVQLAPIQPEAAPYIYQGLGLLALAKGAPDDSPS